MFLETRPKGKKTIHTIILATLYGSGGTWPMIFHNKMELTRKTPCIAKAYSILYIVE